MNRKKYTQKEIDDALAKVNPVWPNGPKLIIAFDGMFRDKLKRMTPEIIDKVEEQYKKFKSIDKDTAVPMSVVPFSTFLLVTPRDISPDNLRAGISLADYDIEDWTKKREAALAQKKANKDIAPKQSGSSVPGANKSEPKPPVEKKPERKYEISHVSGESNGFYGFRVRALKDFGDVKKGDLGGFIQTEQNLSQEGDCWVYDDAMVAGHSKLSGNAILCDKAIAYDSVDISGNARVAGTSTVCGVSRVYGNCMISGNSCIEDSEVFGNAVVESSDVWGGCRVYENAILHYVDAENKIIHGNAIPNNPNGCSKEYIDRDNDMVW